MEVTKANGLLIPAPDEEFEVCSSTKPKCIIEGTRSTKVYETVEKDGQ